METARLRIKPRLPSLAVSVAGVISSLRRRHRLRDWGVRSSRRRDNRRFPIKTMSSEQPLPPLAPPPPVTPKVPCNDGMSPNGFSDSAGAFVAMPLAVSASSRQSCSSPLAQLKVPLSADEPKRDIPIQLSTRSPLTYQQRKHPFKLLVVAVHVKWQSERAYGQCVGNV